MNFGTWKINWIIFQNLIFKFLKNVKDKWISGDHFLPKFQLILAAEQMMNVRYRHVHRDVGHVDGTTDLPPLEVVNLAVACPLLWFRFGSSWCFMTSLETLVHRRRRMDSRSVICQEVGRKWTTHDRPQMPTRGLSFVPIRPTSPTGGTLADQWNEMKWKMRNLLFFFPFDIRSSCLMAQSWQREWKEE